MKAGLAVFILAGALAGPARPAGQPVRTLQFVDDYHVLYRAGTHRVFHPLRRFSGNPVIKGGEKPWEAAIAWMSVDRDPATGTYQLWYQAFSGDIAKDKTRRCVVCYAESRDGIAFTKPDLGLFDYNGDRRNSIVLLANGASHDRYGASVVVDRKDPNRSRRYKMAYYDFTRDEGGVERPGLCVAFSPDGIHWTKYPRAPLVPTYYGYGTPEQPPFAGEAGRPWAVPMTMSDALDAIYDPPRGLFAIYGKMWIDGPDGSLGWKHAMGRVESRDFIHWSPPRLLLAPDDQDPSYVEFHTTPVFFHDDCYFSFLQILHRAVGGGVIDLELGLSRDGLAWRRPFRRQFALARGPAGSFDGGSMFPCATPVYVGHEMRFYYGAYGGGATSEDDRTSTSGIGFATLPDDRFAGIRPDPVSDQPTLAHPLKDIGQVTLKPIRLGPRTVLTLNADASLGTVRVELLDEQGYRIRGFSRDEAVPIRGDSPSHRIAWKQRSMGDLPPGSYLVRLHLDHSEVFALQVEGPPEQ